MLTTSAAMIGAGFTLGLVHALDADHVMAVTALSNEKPSLWRTLRFSMNWALGHGGVLLMAGMGLFAFGVALPEVLIKFAEASVGFVLIFIGLLSLWRFRRQNLQLHQHQHGDVVHTHWHEENHTTEKDTEKAHAPLMVGVLHGLAGSAPALALIPAVAQGDLVLAAAYLLVFSLGVMLSMCFFGAGLGFLQRRLQKNYVRLFNVNRYLIASFSVLFGGYWLTQAL
ncbi:cytochrome C biogenesis DsbD-like protein [Sinobacterium caligoides]|uniref:Cytochrome C biogenesis DsbD-like protein n=1 Tax=Sinobacterium caligoides TaxID=933926 RepID=A0A3N2E001_9GAMM|nr:sulfite exporter TauE/SafE family protein [Sinobacterium caligoides]ROS04895.1 cytochrome C biogenesis DsbD-like protein [Sinobacterium caligoides]